SARDRRRRRQTGHAGEQPLRRPTVPELRARLRRPARPGARQGCGRARRDRTVDRGRRRQAGHAKRTAAPGAMPRPGTRATGSVASHRLRVRLAVTDRALELLERPSWLKQALTLELVEQPRELAPERTRVHRVLARQARDDLLRRERRAEQ